MSLTVSNDQPALADFTPEQARGLTNQIREHLEEDYELIIEAYQRRAWSALGYGTWDDYCAAEFGSTRLKLPREDRQEAVRSLRESGLSIRAIASAAGIDKETVMADLDQVSGFRTPEPDLNDEVVDAEIVDEPGPDVEPEPRKITGTDGKTYPATPKTPPSKPQRTPLPDIAQAAGWEVRKAVEKLERVATDDRFRANKEAIALHLRPHLEHAITTCQSLLDQLNH